MEAKMTKEDEKYIRRCIQLARNAIQTAAPNPMVGAVVVANGTIIGEGYHIRCGEGHAEVNAIASVRRRELLAQSTIYVSLEPCSHYGKTPPCADLIIKSGIPRVVVGCMDPFAKVAGRGIEKLRNAGIEVKVGVLEDECRELNRKFMTFHTLKRPFVTLKWAQSADGFIDREREGGEAEKFSTPYTKSLVHKLRSEHKAILVGTRTAANDNPSLSVRNWSGKSPLRIVVDRELKLDRRLRIFDDSQSTWILCDKKLANKPSDTLNTRFIGLDFSTPESMLSELFSLMYDENIPSLLVEGGARTHSLFIESHAWDEAYVETAPRTLHSGVRCAELKASILMSSASADGNTISHFRSTDVNN